MKREFTQEQSIFRQAYRKFLEQEIAPNIPNWRNNGIVERSAFEKAGEHGFLMIWPDTKYGGLGDTDFRYEQIIIEETCRAGCFEWYNTLHSRLVGTYFQSFGNEEQRERFLPDCVTGKSILAIAMTEPDAGSDLSGIKSTLSDEGDYYLLNGSKTYISNGINSDVIIVAAKQAELSDNKYAMSLVIVERGMEGFARGRNLEKMGQHAQDTAELFFDNVKIPKQNLLGEPGRGFYQLMKGLAEERLIGAVSYAAGARKAFDITREFAATRKMFGKHLCDLQNTQFRFAEMDAEITMLEIFVDHMVKQHNEGNLTANLAAKGKMLGSEIEWRVLDQCLQFHGGAGYMKEYEISEMFTSARVNRIYAGSSEVMRHIIGREVFSEKYRSNLE